MSEPTHGPWVTRGRTTELTRNTLWTLAGHGVRTAAQGLGFLLVTRLLGVRDYGAFAAAVALVSIAIPFAGLGGGSLLIQGAARSPDELAKRWRTAMRVGVTSGLLLWLLAMGSAALVLPHSVPIASVAWIAGAELLLGSLITACAMAYQAVGRLQRTAMLNTLSSVCKLLGIVGLAVITPHPGPTGIAVAYGVAVLVAAGISVGLVSRELCPLFGPAWPGRYPITEGFHFSAGIAASRVYNDLDKVMLARLSSLEGTGAYAAAYRIVDVAYLPILSMFAATYAGFFREGASGIKRCLGFAKRLMPGAVGYAWLASALIFLGSSLIPRILGEQYHDAALATRWLAALPVLRVIHSFAADSLTGAGYQSLRSRLQIAVAVFNYAINLWLIPAHGWLGAAWASLLSDGALVVALWASVAVIAQRERDSSVSAGSESEWRPVPARSRNR